VAIYNVSPLQITPHLSSYNATALAMIKPRKHQRLTDSLLQSGVVNVTPNKRS